MKARHAAALSVLLIALAAMPAVAAEQGRSAVPLQRGAYVNDESPCGTASNSVLMWYNGRFFSAGRMSHVIPRATKEQNVFTSTMIDAEGDTDPVKVILLGRGHFLWSSKFGAQKKRFCSDAALPEMWRHMTPQ